MIWKKLIEFCESLSFSALGEKNKPFAAIVGNAANGLSRCNLDVRPLARSAGDYFFSVDFLAAAFLAGALAPVALALVDRVAVLLAALPAAAAGLALGERLAGDLAAGDAFAAGLAFAAGVAFAAGLALVERDAVDLAAVAFAFVEPPPVVAFGVAFAAVFFVVAISYGSFS